jgi:hypothetical protein
MPSSDAGKWSDANDERPESAFASIRIKFEPDSNVNDDSELQRDKHSSQRISTEAVIQVDSDDEHKASAFASIRIKFDPDSNANVESNHNGWNSLYKEFQPQREYKLIPTTENLQVPVTQSDKAWIRIQRQ